MKIELILSFLLLLVTIKIYIDINKEYYNYYDQFDYKGEVVGTVYVNPDTPTSGLGWIL